MKRSALTNPLTQRLAALSELLRLRICGLLEQHELSVGEICKVFQVPQSTASRHLRVLSDAGWLVKWADGPTTFYRLPIDELPEEARALWEAVRQNLELKGTLSEDQRRMEAVLAARRTDSLAFFGRVAGEWDQMRAELFGRHFAAQALLGLLPREWVVADLGCGTGSNAEILAPHVREVICVDQSQPMLKAARKRLTSFGNVRFVQGPLETLPLDDDSVDAAICLLVLHHVDSPMEALGEMRRIVRPGGSVLVVDMREHDRAMYRSTMGHVHLGFAPNSMKARIEEAGFDQVRVASLPSDPEAKGPGLFAAVGQ